MAKSSKPREKYGVNRIVARNCGCTPEYVYKIMNNRLGQYKGKAYKDRDTELANKIRKEHARITTFLNSQAQPA